MYLFTNAPMKLHRGNLFLVGLMGAGKSTLGKPLSTILNKSFWDADSELEERSGRSIADIFTQDGEAFFRMQEEALLSELVSFENIVLATGGGVVLRENNREKLRNHGTVLYLCATPEILAQRLQRDCGNRPLLYGTTDMLERQRALYLERDVLYRQTAHLVFEESHGDTMDGALAAMQSLLAK